MDDPAPPEGGSPSATRDRSTGWNWLLAIPLLGTLFPMVYNHADPRLGGIPFFYWYQLLWIPISVLATVAVYRATGRR